MKTKLLLILIAGLQLCLFSCKKDFSASNSGSIIGKWYVNKEEVTAEYGGLNQKLDTIYNNVSFNSNDFFQFSSRDSALVSSSGDFEVNGKAVFTDGAGTVINGINKFTYNVSGTVLTLSSTFLHPATNSTNPGPVTETIELLDTKNMVLFYTLQGAGATFTYRTYYTKGN
ncbi:hypothetical protein [Mucilaginibacter gotjawali]|uniref:Uncharacterized protein n=2 Tax=Mucilaginibacter gotjawali TaxID=1550579 RepID=A0A110B1N7_9SPHI|nr:hypothetical protein [Mucilaginibacter gotjawali]MBB3057211.1 hypothetical protein [Mucilaginibacter gotjawali]BAU53022.1 hypothetical protein MgSA37_01189 [Mucilaginibacter gotjawali]